MIVIFLLRAFVLCGITCCVTHLNGWNFVQHYLNNDLTDLIEKFYAMNHDKIMLQIFSHNPSNPSKPLFRIIPFNSANSFTFSTKLKSLMIFFIFKISLEKILSSSANDTNERT